MTGWDVGQPYVSSPEDVSHEQIANLFIRGFSRMETFWLSGMEGEGILEQLQDGSKIRRWTFTNGKKNGLCIETWWDFECSVMCTYKNDRLHGEYRQWPIMRGRGEWCYYINGRKTGEVRKYDEAFNGSTLLDHYYLTPSGERYEIEDAKKRFPNGWWIDDKAEYTEQIKVRPLI